MGPEWPPMGPEKDSMPLVAAVNRDQLACAILHVTLDRTVQIVTTPNVLAECASRIEVIVALRQVQ